MAWLRLYDDLLDNHKIQTLSDRAFRGLINMWCVAKRNDGIIPGDIGALMFALRMQEGKVRDLLQCLLSAGLIERCSDGYVPHQWTEHQYQSDSNAAERMRRYRQRNAERNVTADVTRNDVGTRDVLEQRQIQKQSRTDTPKPPHASRSVLNGSSELFRAFYETFPLHKSRRAAEKAYISALKRASPEQLLIGAQRYAADPARKPEFTKHPASWLNADGWLDEATNAKPNAVDELVEQWRKEAENGQQS